MNNPRLYIIMRSDIADMNPGKGMAQAAHAQALLSNTISVMAMNTNDEQDNHFVQAYEDWADEADGFGTTLVLDATLEEMKYMSEHGDDALSGFVVDPTYPFTNAYGELFVKSEVTCMYIFVTPETDEDYLIDLKLMNLHV